MVPLIFLPSFLVALSMPRPYTFLHGLSSPLHAKSDKIVLRACLTPSPRGAMFPPVSKQAERLRSLRRAKGLSLQALSELSGVGKKTLIALEHDQWNAHRATLVAVAAALETPVEELFDGRGTS